MGSDIFTESAVAIEVVDFLRKAPIKKKPVRTNIANILFKHDYIDEQARDAMIKNRDGFIDTFSNALSIGRFDGDESEYSSGLFETVMTDEGKEFAETLGTNYIQETTWTVHSY